MKKLFIFGLLLAASPAVFAVTSEAPRAPRPTNETLMEIGIDQKLNERIPLDLQFRNEFGREVRLGDYFGKKPVVLNFVYFRCPMLCGFVLDGLVKTLKPLRFTPGHEFEILTVSIDHEDRPEDALAKKEKTLKAYHRPGGANGWHFLTGPKESIEALTKAAGFRYVYDEKSRQFAHAGGIMVLTPEGNLARYFYGIEYSSRDLQFSLMEAAKGKIGNIAEQLLLLCFHYDPMTGKYGFVVMNALRIGGILTLVLLGAGIAGMTLRGRAGAA